MNVHNVWRVEKYKYMNLVCPLWFSRSLCLVHAVDIVADYSGLSGRQVTGQVRVSYQLLLFLVF